MKEDRLGAITILCDFWHNRRKKHTEILKEEQVALASAGKQNQICEIIHCVVVYTATSMDYLLQWTVAINFACNEQYWHANYNVACNAAGQTGDDDGEDQANGGGAPPDGGEHNAGHV